MNLNQINLIGRLVRDPQTKYLPDGKQVTEFTIAVNRQFQKGKTDFFKCVAWRKLAEICSEYLEKGSGVFVQGELHKEEYETKEKVKKSTSQISIDKMQILTYKRGEEEVKEVDIFNRTSNFPQPETYESDVPF